ncbi:MAG TPA: hypothetical protein VLI44_04550 [Sporolactobacillaceae bacterium]|nr:hypothetical protein [Sporolactobacillaceae bacterium]
MIKISQGRGMFPKRQTYYTAFYFGRNAYEVPIVERPLPIECLHTGIKL